MTEPASLRDRVRDRWRDLRDRLCGAFEAIEDEAAGLDLYPSGAPGRFERTAWRRPEENGQDAGGGVMSVMRGRVFEKVGVNFSEVFGDFSPEFAKQIPGADENPSFWACGVSLVAHMRNPRTPSAHMNVRRIETAKGWFGGGGDLNPMLDAMRGREHEDAVAFHNRFKQTCDAFDPSYYEKFAAWADEYFFNKHRNEPRGVGGIFFDYHDTGDVERDFDFAADVGQAFLEGFTAAVRRRMAEPWSAEEKEEQLVRRGRYAEFNLVWDRGTKFGLNTGGNVEAILMSLPPEAKWP